MRRGSAQEKFQLSHWGGGGGGGGGVCVERMGVVLWEGVWFVLR